MTETLKKIACKNRKAWRLWLQKNYSQKGVWLIYFKKHTKKPSVFYNDAVEEAICFGWVDGQAKRIDDEKYMQRYTLRRARSHWSEINIARAKKMIKQGLMTNRGLKIFQDGIKNKEKVPSSKNFTVPDDFKSALTKSKKASHNFHNFSPSAKLAYVYWMNIAKTDETRLKRIKKSVELITQNKKYGEK